MFLVMLMIIIILAFYLLKKQTKNFSYLLWFLLIYWVVNIIASLIIFNNFSWKFFGLSWIILACIVFCVTYDFTFEKIKDRNNEKSEIGIDKSISTVFLCITIGLALVYVNMLVNSFGYKITALFNIDKLIELNKIASDRRYSGNDNHPMYMQALLVFVYASVMIGGYSFNYQQKKLSKIICFLSFIPILLILLIENTKATLLSGIILWAGGYLVGYLELHKKFPKPNIKKISLFLGISTILVMLFVLSMLLRIGSFSNDTFTEVFYKFFNYGFGHIAAFDYWFSKYLSNVSYTYGQYTFFGLINFLGIKTRVMGVYPEKLQSGIIDTNIYTANRGIISDFGIVGGLIFYAIIGAIAAICYKRVIRNDRHHELSTTILLVIFVFISYSVLISIFTYMSYIVAFAVFFAYLITVNKGERLINLFRKRVNNE